MISGKILWEKLCSKYYSGTNFVDQMIDSWLSLEKTLDPDIYLQVKQTNKTKSGCCHLAG